MVEGEPAHKSNELSKEENQQSNEEAASTELVVRHPLENKWTLWFYENKNKNWEDNVHEVASFDTVEDFWCLFNHIKPPSQLSMNCDYNYFKNGIKPMWEDPSNTKGGRWLLQLPAAKSNPYVDEYWKNIIMSIIGEVYNEQSHEINGAIVNVRGKGTKIAVWTNNASKDNAENILAIGKKIREILGSQNEKLVYESHTDTATKVGSFAKPAFVL
ncbi:eukaryotic translation initiation factor 4E-like [Daktulosphaira vitifoliae]|uniref:eIF-4F 25 kDa subunit n=1 Tax=Daktulosphaira vitifoliae TaxID=58002 RepID=A0A481SY38_DAKVI|nr:eukaryotic translation initiation factor 4E-like [Daktulosphaira vitifoliae]QBH73391.1 eukaryotic translation initiation factor 4e [Daktulosphaira vitifoliae]